MTVIRLIKWLIDDLEQGNITPRLKIVMEDKEGNHLNIEAIYLDKNKIVLESE